MTKIVSGWLALLILSVLLAACSDNTATPNSANLPFPTPPSDNGLVNTVKASPNKIILGVMTPGVGADGWTAVGGATIAGELINRAGGLAYGSSNFYVSLVAHDDVARPDGVASAFTQMVNEEDVSGFVGPSAVEGLAPNLRLVSDLATPELLTLTSESLLTQTQQNPYLFYLRPLDHFWAEAVINYLVGSDILKTDLKIGLVSQQSDEGQSGAKLIKSGLAAKAKLTPQIEVELPAFEGKMLKDHNQYAVQAQKLAALAPALIINWSNSDESIELLTELHQQGWHGQYITTGLSEQFVRLLKTEAEGVIGPATWTADAPDPDSQKFVQTYQAYFQQTPDDHAAAVYDGIHLLTAAYKQFGPDKAKIQTWLAHLNNWPGLQGSYTARPDGELITQVKMARIKDGKIVTLVAIPK